MKTLELLFLEELSDIYDAERRLIKALPKMAKAATHADLRRAFSEHLAETVGHVARLRKIFQLFDKRPRARKCWAIIGLLKDGEAAVAANQTSATLNAALVSNAQKIEHYEIAAYGCLREWAEDLGQERAAQLLQEILDEEKSADQKLTQVARHHSNDAALPGDAPRFLAWDFRLRRDGYSRNGTPLNGDNHADRRSTAPRHAIAYPPPPRTLTPHTL